MESRAKQRLTGAVILVALVVLLVPELLKGPGDSQPAAETPADEGLRRYTIDLDAQNSAGQPMAPAGSEAPVALPEIAAPMNPAAERAVPGEAAAPPESAPATNPAQPPNNLASTPPASAPAASTVSPAPAHTETPRPAPVNVPRGSFVVQLGSFGSKENAERLVRDMTAKGFTTFIAPITTNGRELYRVRVGPTRDRASAEALATELKRIGQSGSIVPIS
jgi:DedD protein